MKHAILCLVFLAPIIFSFEIKLTLNKKLKTLQLYTPNNKILNFQLNFTSKDIIFDPLLKNKTLYFNKNIRQPLHINSTVPIKYTYKKIEGIVEDEGEEIYGSIGLSENCLLFKLLKANLKSNYVKLEVDYNKGTFTATPQRCLYPLFFPFKVTLSEHTTSTFNIDKLSMNFEPNPSELLNIIGQKKAPFEMTPKQLQQQVTVSIRDRIISIPLKKLLKCSKYSTSNNYQCDINQPKKKKYQPQYDMGQVLLQFNPTICNKGIELYSNTIEGSQTFHYGHLALLILQFAALALYMNDLKVIKKINEVLQHNKII